MGAELVTEVLPLEHEGDKGWVAFYDVTGEPTFVFKNYLEVFTFKDLELIGETDESQGCNRAQGEIIAIT